MSRLPAHTTRVVPISRLYCCSLNGSLVPSSDWCISPKEKKMHQAHPPWWIGSMHGKWFVHSERGITLHRSAHTFRDLRAFGDSIAPRVSISHVKPVHEGNCNSPSGGGWLAWEPVRQISGGLLSEVLLCSSWSHFEYTNTETILP